LLPCETLPLHFFLLHSLRFSSSSLYRLQVRFKTHCWLMVVHLFTLGCSLAYAVVGGMELPYIGELLLCLALGLVFPTGVVYLWEAEHRNAYIAARHPGVASRKVHLE